jgi:hypothetical protein
LRLTSRNEINETTTQHFHSKAVAYANAE